MGAFRRCCCLSVALALLGLLASSGTAAASGDASGRIVFEHVSAGGGVPPTIDIWSVNADGSEVRALTTDGHSHGPAWSADGRQIFFIHDTLWPANLPKLQIRVGKPHESYFALELYEMDSNGGDRRLIHRFDGSIRAVVCSPDGKSVAGTYNPALKNASRQKPWFGSFVMPTGGEAEPDLLFRGSSWPVWSPDGMKLAFSVRLPVFGQAIAIGDADGSHEVQLTHPSQYKKSPWIHNALSPVWSPDGKSVAFEADPVNVGLPFNTGGSEFQIFVVRTDGSNMRQLTNDFRWLCEYPSWSPDGKLIAFDAVRLDGKGIMRYQQQIFVMRSDGSDLRQLTFDPKWECWRPSWSPDGTEIAFSCIRSPAACLGAEPIDGQPPPCVRRIFAVRLNDPHARPVQLTHVDSWNPVFCPVP